MTRTSYQAQLVELREGVLGMSALVCERLRSALHALETNDDALAEAVITGDHEVNQRYLDLEHDCIELFALQQPVAGDLRFVAASFKIITDLERIADLATNLGRYTLEGGRDRYAEIDVVGLGETTVEMVEDAMAAYETDDADATRAIAARDDDVDRRCADASAVVMRDLLAHDGAGGGVEAVEPVIDDVSRILLTIRDLERVGDHAVNVAARTLYMVANDDELIY